MFNTPLLLLASVIAFSVEDREIRHQPDHDYLYGPVKSVLVDDLYLVDTTFTRIEGRVDVIIGQAWSISKVNYDKNGRRSSSLSMYENGNWERQQRTEYDSAGRAESITIYQADTASNFSLRYTYDSLNRTSRVFSYDYKNQLKYQTDLHHKGDTSISYLFHANGEKYRENYKSVMVTDSAENTMNTISYNADNELIFRAELQRNTSEQTVRFTSYHSSGTHETSYLYDENKICIGGEVKDDGQLIEQWSFTHEYDSFGNWIKRVVYLDGIPYCIIERQIEYYQFGRAR